MADVRDPPAYSVRAALAVVERVSVLVDARVELLTPDARPEHEVSAEELVGAVRLVRPAEEPAGPTR